MHTKALDTHPLLLINPDHILTLDKYKQTHIIHTSTLDKNYINTHKPYIIHTNIN